MADIDYRQFVKAFMDELKSEKAAGTTPTFQPGHGNGGLFSNSDLDASLYGAFVLPNYGLYAALPKYPTVLEYLLAGIVTGITDTTGSEPDGLCDDPPYAGLMKLCQQAYPLGRFSRMSRVGELNAFGKMRGRGEQSDLTLYGNPGDSLPGTPATVGGNPLQSESEKMLFELGIAWMRDFAPQIFTGTPTDNSAKSGTKYFYGLDSLINTGYKDAISGTACAAADSLVLSFGDVNIGTAAGGAALVNMVTQMIWELWLNRATEMNLAPVVGALVMRPQLFHILTSYWACTYATYRCNTSSNDTSTVMSTDALAMRAEMRQGNYLLVDDQKIPVITDSAVAYTSAADFQTRFLTGFLMDDGFVVSVTGWYALDWYNNGSASVTVDYLVDVYTPVVGTNSIADESYVNSRTLVLRGVTEGFATGVLLGTDPLHLQKADLTGRNWAGTVPLAEGRNTIIMQSYY